ncbi:hypothetical protein LCGC14_2415610, partial [marine sediment metagenome]
VNLNKQGAAIGEQRAFRDKAGAELDARLFAIDETLEKVRASVVEHNKDTEANNKSVYDLIMNGKQETLSGWGYGSTVERALYNPLTRYVPGKGYVHSGKGYEVSDDVMYMNDLLMILGTVKAFESHRTGDNITYSQAVKSLDTYKLFNFELERNSELRKALSTGATGEGAEFVPTGFSAKLIDDIRLDLKVAALFQRITMPKGSGSWESPLRGDSQRAYLLGEAASDSSTKIPTITPPTGKLTFTAITQGARMLFSYDMDEDSAIAILPYVLASIRDSLVEGEEDSILNGDNASTHQDSDVTASNDIRKSFDGLRLLSGGSSGNAAVDISTFNTSALRSMRKAMGKYGVNNKQTAYITGISGYIQMLGLTEVLTMDLIGNKATVVQGQLAQFDGSPIVVSEFVRQDLTTAGIYDGATTTDTIIMLVNHKAFWAADKPGGILIEQGKDIEVQQNVVVASRRMDFKRARTPGSGEQSVALGYSLTT